MASVEIVDETVVVVPRRVLAAVVSERHRWTSWWPGLDVVVMVDRGDAGMSWALAGAVVGVAEVELADPQEGSAGVVVRYRMSVDPSAPGTRTVARVLSDSPHGRREREQIRARQTLAWKRTMWALTDEVESGTWA